MISYRKARTAFANLAALAVALGLALATAEGVLRVRGFSFHLMPERFEFGFPDPVSMQFQFLEDDHLLWVTPDHGDRVAALKRRGTDVLFLGDSCPQLGEFDAHFGSLLEGRHPGHDVRIDRLAVSGWSTYQGLIQMRTDVPEMKPRVVFIHFGWNDHWIGFGIEDKVAGRIKAMARVVPQSLQRLRLVQLAIKAIVRWESAGEGTPNRVAPEDFRRNLANMILVARDHGIHPVLATAPTSHVAGREPAYLAERWVRTLDELVPLHRKYIDITREVAGAKRASLCDLARRFDQIPDPDYRDRLFMTDGIHFTSEGADTVASMLYDCLEETGLFPELRLQADPH